MESRNLLECSIDELLTERQIAIKNGNLDRYRECNEIISTLCNNKLSKEDCWDGDESHKALQ